MSFQILMSRFLEITITNNFLIIGWSKPYKDLTIQLKIFLLLNSLSKSFLSRFQKSKSNYRKLCPSLPFLPYQFWCFIFYFGEIILHISGFRNM